MCCIHLCSSGKNEWWLVRLERGSPLSCHLWRRNSKLDKVLQQPSPCQWGERLWRGVIQSWHLWQLPMWVALMACMCQLYGTVPQRHVYYTVLPFLQVTLPGPRGHLVLVVALVGRKALLWPPESARVPRSAVLDREPAQKAALTILVTRGQVCQVTVIKQMHT